MTTSYTKSLSTDFGGNLNATQFHKEVEADSGIAPTCLTVANKADVVEIVFSSALSSGEQTTLNNLISAHNAIITGDRLKSNTTVYETTSTTYQTRDTLTTHYLSEGEYKIDWFYTFISEDGTPDIRVIIDDTTVIHTNNTRVPVISDTIEYDKMGFDIQTLTSGQHTIKLEFKGSLKASTTIVLSRLFISEV